jgi:hypothetical protein
VAEVAEHAFFALAEPCECTRFAALVASADPSCHGGPAPPWLHARIGFHGVVTGSLEVLLPRELACDLVAALIGADGTDSLTDEQLDDVAGELANMVCGALLTRTDRDQRFELHPPRLTRTPPVEGIDGASDGDLYFCLNDRPVVIRFSTWDK